MEAYIDSYAQAKLLLSAKDLQDLAESGKITGEIARYATGSSEYFDPYTLPLDEIRAYGIPLDKTWEEKERYEIALMPRHII